MPQTRKEFIEQFLECVNDPKVKDLDRYMEKDVQKTLDSKVIYNNIEEAEEYYKKERDNDTTSQWTMVELEPEDENKNTIRARISHDNKTSDTVYTFSGDGKIQRIDVVN